jgi:hypothetical protein
MRLSEESAQEPVPLLPLSLLEGAEKTAAADLLARRAGLVSVAERVAFAKETFSVAP